MIPPLILNPEPTDAVLDLCAAPVNYYFKYIIFINANITNIILINNL